MTDGTGSIHSLAGLLEAEVAEWDPSALANWPNLPAAADFTAVPQAGDA